MLDTKSNHTLLLRRALGGDIADGGSIKFVFL